MANRQRGRVLSSTQEDIYDEKIDITVEQFDLPEYDKSRVSQKVSQESKRPVLTSATKQPKRKLLTKVLIGVLVVTGVLIALLIFITFILASIQVHLLKETHVKV